jgi:tim44-like domain|uniref:TIM44-like domain-containing protein n=1 Tax=Roseburia sp. TaxID=2049040 RepID=UPI003FEDE36F
MSSGQIIFLVILAALLGGGFYGYHVIRTKIESFSRAAFGTKSLVEGLEQQADLIAETPKSVSGMTRIFEPQIQKDFPDFNLVQFKNKAENMLISALQAISAGNVSLLRETSNELTEQVRNQIQANAAEGVTETYRQIHIHRTEITNYVKREGKCIITFQSAVEYFHYKEKEGRVTDGDKERKQQTKYNIEVMYIQNEKLAKLDNAVGTTCPNCGAPIVKLGALYCEYCGTAVTPINLKVWTLHRYYEVDYHHV